MCGRFVLKYIADAHELTDEDINELVSQADEDGDGYITYEGKGKKHRPYERHVILIECIMSGNPIGTSALCPGTQ